MTDKSKVSDEEIFVEKEPKDPWTARPLTPEGTARLIQLIGEFFGDAADRAAMMKIVSGSEDEKMTRAASLRFALGALDKDKLTELLSIIVGKSPTWVGRNYSLLKASKVIGEFFEQENFGQVLKNLRPAAGEFLGAEENAGSLES